MAKCPVCEDRTPYRVIYGGLPMWLCSEEECSAVWGWWAWWIDVIGYDGWFFQYEGCGYLEALWDWLFTDWRNE